jgi:putative transposase
MATTLRKPYPKDLMDKYWMILQLLIPSAKPGGRPRQVSLCEGINTILFLNQIGC